jgi:23S rRNA maturation-related 3'-5' exoribonuclease YhaM
MLGIITLALWDIQWSQAFVMVIGLPIVSTVFISVVAMSQHHRRKMAELKIKEHKVAAEDVRAEIESLRQEMKNLRDVTTQYDLSFDTTLQQVERRVSQLESARYTSTPESAQQSQHLGGGRQY